MPNHSPPGARLPRFVEYPSVQTLPGPIQFTGVRMSSFFLDADLPTLQKLCTKLIDDPSGGAVTFTPLLPYVVMGFCEFPESYFVDYAEQGMATERELSFGIPGYYRAMKDDGSVEISLSILMPFLFLDNPVALMTGRENYGYFKQTGTIRLPQDPGSDGFAAVVYGCPHFCLTARWGQHSLVTLTRAGPPPLAADAALEAKLGKPWADAVAAVHGRYASPAPAVHPAAASLADFLMTPKLPQIFLKQFRDIADGRNACYQAVTQTIYTVSRISEISLETSHAFSLTALDSTPIAAALGLAPATETGIGVRICLDMRLENGGVLWQA